MYQQNKFKCIISKGNLKILSFNVEGLESEFNDPLFTDLLYAHAICLLYETWRCSDSKLALPGLWDYSQIRQKTKKLGRHSGGITVICKEEIRAGLKVMNSKEGFIWMRLESDFFSLNNDLFICASYIPPEYSSNNISKKTDYFQSLTDSLINYSNQGNIMLL